MSEASTIQWTDSTPNPSTGCKRRSAGCNNCYAFVLHDRRYVAWKRGRWDTAPTQYHLPFSRIQLFPERLDLLRRLARVKTPRRIFVDSMSDLFCGDELDGDAQVPVEFIEQVWAAMAEVYAAAPHHTFQILTKRARRMRDVVNEVLVPRFGVLPNVQLGHSVENQDAAEERLDDLRQTQAAVRFISAEPLLGPLTLWMRRGYLYTAEVKPVRSSLAFVDWVIIGGESGTHARPLNLAWIESLIAQCREAGTAVFVKQLGSLWARERDTLLQLKGKNKTHSHGGDPAEWPDHLRIREFPVTDRQVPA